MKLAELKNVSAFIPGDRERKLAVRDVSLEVKKGGRYAFFGANGSGKSTLLRLLRGELRPASGSLAWYVNGVRETSALAGLKISRLVSPRLQEELLRRPVWLTARQFLNNSENFLNVPGLGGIGDKYLAELSQGQLRAILLLRALLDKPALLLLDEWSVGLDAEKTAFFKKAFDGLRDAAIVYATHNPEELPDKLDEILEMSDGELRPGEAKIYSRPLDTSPTPPVSGLPLCEIKNANVYIERRLILKNINWRWLRGENWLIYGANGSGKSTLLRAIAGEEFIAAGGSLTFYSPKNGVTRTLAERKKRAPLVSDLAQTLYGYPLTALELILSGFDNVVGVYREYSREEKTRARALLDRLFDNGEKIAETSIRRLSTGQLRRLFLARALLSDPDVLLLDEPFTGLDAESRRYFRQTLLELSSAGRINFALVSHDPKDGENLVNRRGLINAGELTVIT